MHTWHEGAVIRTVRGGRIDPTVEGLLKAVAGGIEVRHGDQAVEELGLRVSAMEAPCTDSADYHALVPVGLPSAAFNRHAQHCTRYALTHSRTNATFSCANSMPLPDLPGMRMIRGFCRYVAGW